MSAIQSTKDWLDSDVDFFTDEARVRRTLIAIELLTALILVYLAFFLSWQSAPQVLAGLQLTFGASGCAIAALGAMRNDAWAPKATVLAAAFNGLPNISTVAQLLQLAHTATSPAVVLSTGLLLTVTTLQLVALLLGLRRLSGVVAV